MMIETISELTAQSIADYIRLDITDDTATENELRTYLNVAKHYISDYTGLPITSEDAEEKTLDSYPNLVIVALILCQDMYDNRSLYPDAKTIVVNKTAESILNMHARNLL